MTLAIGTPWPSWMRSAIQLQTKEQAATNWPQKSREIRWKMNSPGEELEEDGKENVEASDSVQTAESEDARNSQIAAPATMVNKQINMTRSANARNASAAG